MATRSPDESADVRGSDRVLDDAWRRGIFRVGDWEADLSLNLLRGKEQVVRLEPKAMEVLAYLASRSDEVVPRDLLLEEVWPGVIVGDDTLTQAVIKLRKGLGDDARTPRYIETVPKRGYRLVAPVTAAGVRPSVAEPRRPEGKRRLARLWPAAVVAPIGLLVAVGLLPDREANPPKSGTAQATALTTNAPPAPAARPRLVVMPFSVLGDHPEQRYLAEGLAAVLAMDLSRMSGLDVIHADAIAQRVGDVNAGAATLFRVFGAVQRTPERISVEVRLVESRSGREMWSERYYRSIGDLFAIRDDIKSRVANALSVKISKAERLRQANDYSRSTQAYDAFLRAKSALLLRTADGNQAAEAFYRQAIELDATFARAYGGLALIHAADYRNQWSDDPTASLRRALAMAETAVRIDPDLPEAQWVLGYVAVQDRRHDDALAHLDKALAAAPAFADAFALRGGINTYIGNPRAAIQLLRDAMRLKPSAGYLYYLLLGRAYFFVDDFEQAEINLREAIARNPANLEAHVYLAATLMHGGDEDGANWETEEIRSLAPEFSTQDWLKTYPMTDAGQIQRLASTLDALRL